MCSRAVGLPPSAHLGSSQEPRLFPGLCNQLCHPPSASVLGMAFTEALDFGSSCSLFLPLSLLSGDSSIPAGTCKLCRVCSWVVLQSCLCLPLAIHSVSGFMGLISRHCAASIISPLTAPPLVLHIHLATSFQQLVDLCCFLTVSYLLLSGLDFSCPPGPLLSFLLPLAPLCILNFRLAKSRLSWF